MKFLVRVFVLSLILINCKEKNSSETANFKVKQSEKVRYAKGFDIQYFDSYKKLIIKSPYQNSKEQFEYILSNSENKEFTSIKGTIITTPIQQVVVTSTTHIPMLELLGVENSLIGFPHTKYISSTKTRKLIDANFVKEIGVKDALNTEILLDLNPDVVIGYSMTKTNKSLNLIEKSGIPVVLNGDWLEDTPLGRAEWIKFFGILYNKEKEADSIFNVIETNYKAAKKLANNATKIPTVLSGAIMSKDIWNLPAGESFVAQFLTDANTNYLWKDSKGKGSLSISFESILDKGKSAKIWIAPGYFSSKKQMLEKNAYYKEFTAFKNDQLYTFATKTGETGGVLYFELGPTRPDLVLKDIIKITHPELLKEYTTTFFEKMK
ncbi:ABC transporter substrate-binding protein [Polaribacter uvawellassae]|uniref:ABC transporter substrate-binding protein n=1 Tax=Polaribacter uvawellassae TaxID=3133495 RepID=UPI00321B4A34